MRRRTQSRRAAPLAASGVLSLTDGVRLVHLRGGLMQDAVPIEWAEWRL